MSLFSGMGGDSLGIKKAGGNVVAYSEFWNKACESHDLNFPGCTLLRNDKEKPKDQTNIQKITDAQFEEHRNKIDLIFAGFPCFVKGTPVLTNAGYKNIENVNLHDTLLTHTGQFKKINNLQTKMYSGFLYTIYVKYHHHNIVCSEEHPFYVRTKTKNGEKNGNIFDTPKWKKAKELTDCDYVGMVVNKKSIIPELTTNKGMNKNFSLKLTTRLDDPDMWYMMGYFLGDGWVEDTTKKNGNCMNKIIFAMNTNDETEVLTRIRKILPITDIQCPTGKCNKYGCSNKRWYNILKLFGKYAHGKVIPEWVHDAPNEYISEFINGYKKADGNIRNTRCSRYTTVSQDIAYGIQRLYLKLGLVFGTQKDIRPYSHIIQGREVKQRNTYCISGYEQLKRPSLAFIDDDYVWFPISIKKNTGTNIQVFNFEVDEDNSYIVSNVIVHNCQGFSNGGKKKENDPRNSLFNEFVRATRLINPKYIIGENVQGLLSRKTASKENYIDVIKAEFERIGYSVHYKVCLAEEYNVPQKRRRLIIVGIRNDIDQAFSFPEGNDTNMGLESIIKFNMEGTIKIDEDDFDMTSLPEECIVTDLNNTENEDTENIHPYLKLKAKIRNQTWADKTHHSTLSFGKRDSPIHAEIVDIRNPSKTIICTYDHQPRLFVPIRNSNGYYLRCILPDELKQIQGFPPDYQLSGNKKEKIKQIGNAVPPPLIEVIVKKLVIN